MDYKRAVANIRKELREYLAFHKLKALVIGISGGIDSALCAILSKPVCDELGIKLFSRSLPIQTNKEKEIIRARKFGAAFKLDFKEVDLTNAYSNLSSAIYEHHDESELDSKIREGNIKVRIRMVYLYNLARLHQGMVLSTDNWTEMMLGFFTLHGDTGDYGLIQYLDKTEVYGMSRYLVNDFLAEGEKMKAEALQSCIDAIPTDGLGITNSDLDQIQADSYEEVDRILHSYIDQGDLSVKNHPVIQRYEKTHFKRNNPVNIPRERIFSN